jgi:hypothetical protein
MLKPKNGGFQLTHFEVDVVAEKRILNKVFFTITASLTLPAPGNVTASNPAGR